MARAVGEKLAKGGGIAGDMFPEKVEVMWPEIGVHDVGISDSLMGRP